MAKPKKGEITIKLREEDKILLTDAAVTSGIKFEQYIRELIEVRAADIRARILFETRVENGN